MAPRIFGVISDTHLETLSEELVATLERVLPETRTLLHAGDVTSPDVLDELEARGWTVVAVRGNMDFEPELQARLPELKILDVDGVSVGLIHGWGGPTDIRERILTRFQRRPDVVVYGHTHHPDDTVLAGVRMLNPGSPTDRRFAPYRSVGRLTIDSDNPRRPVQFEILRLD